MQEGFGSNVVVQQRSSASQFGQCKPQPQEVGLVLHQESHRVSLLELAMLLQSSGYSVARLIRLAVGERGPLEKCKRFLRLLGHLVQKAVQNTVKRFVLLNLSQLHADAQRGDRVAQVIQNIRVFKVQP